MTPQIVLQVKNNAPKDRPDPIEESCVRCMHQIGKVKIVMCPTHGGDADIIKRRILWDATVREVHLREIEEEKILFKEDEPIDKIEMSGAEADGYHLLTYANLLTI